MGTTICIDYGTAMSKVAVSIDGAAPFAIPLGQCEGDPVKEYAIDSSLFFGADGHIYMGTLAIRKSTESARDERRRLDSLKAVLTSGDLRDLRTVSLPGEVNHTACEFSISGALALMFAHIL